MNELYLEMLLEATGLPHTLHWKSKECKQGKREKERESNQEAKKYGGEMFRKNNENDCWGLNFLVMLLLGLGQLVLKLIKTPQFCLEIILFSFLLLLLT